jgi:hypothetical protein
LCLNMPIKRSKSQIGSKVREDSFWLDTETGLTQDEKPSF